eukprot:COSAG06_NODE_1547_length_9132_cov_3.139046_1_plen_122_part_00
MFLQAYSCVDKKLSPTCAAAVAATKCGTGGQRPANCELCLKNQTTAAVIKAAGCTDLSDSSIQYFCQGGSLCEPAIVQRLRHNYASKIERLDTVKITVLFVPFHNIETGFVLPRQARDGQS